ncbi:hypothetical protein L7F22_014010 [Adiantum nelumboides]|nr:hypothetical protein [Adiantum nelumboides]
MKMNQPELGGWLAIASHCHKLARARVSKGKNTLYNLSTKECTICVQCLEKLPSYNSRQTYACNAYSFNYLVEHGFVFLVVANDSVGRELPFAFLERTIKEDFLEGDQTTNDFDIELELEDKSDIAYRLDKEFGPN